MAEKDGGFQTSEDGPVAAAAENSCAYVWTNTLPGVAYRFPYPHSMKKPDIALSADGAMFAVLSPDRTTALVWDLRTLPGLAPPATRPATQPAK